MSEVNVYAIIDFLVTCLEIGFVLFLLSNEEIKGKKSKPLILFVVLTMVTVLMTRADCGGISKEIIGILLVVLLGKYIYNCSYLKLFVYAVAETIALSFSEDIIIKIWSIYSRPIFADNIIYEDFVLSLVIVAKAVHFFLIVLLKYIMNANRNDYSTNEVFPVIVIGIPFLFVMECLSLTIPGMGQKEKIWSLAGSAAMLFVFIFIMVFFQKYLEVRKKAQQEETALYELQLKYEYFQRRKEDEERVREIYHDLKNHFLLVEDFNMDEGLKKKIKAYEYYYSTGNDFLDIVVNEKMNASHNKGINMECHIDFKNTEFIEPMDISTIFGNLLDNAIEASEKVHEDEKHILVNIQEKGNMKVIVIKNRMVHLQNGSYRTSKSNKSFHGYGIENVKKAINIYNGEIELTATNSEFIVSALIPIPRKE